MSTQITLTNKHGDFTTSGYGLDCALTAYLPASPNDLRKIVEDATGLDYSDVHYVSEFLIILADLDFPGSRFSA